MIAYTTLILLMVVYLIYLYITKNYDYWKKRKVAYVKPSLIFGNYKDYILLKKWSPKIAQEICHKFPNEPYVGVFYGTDPALIIKDPSLIKLVLTKDFYYFTQREISDFIHKEDVENMFFNGGDVWKVLRQNSTSLFSSAKMKKMFYFIRNGATNLETALDRKMSKDNVVEMKSLLARYTMDCVGSCVFGVSTGTLTDDSSSNPFTVMSQKLFDTSIMGGLKLVVRSMFPAVFYGLGFRLLKSDTKLFFENLLTNVFKSRDYKESSKNDFIDHLLTWKKNNYIKGDSLSNVKTKGKDVVNLDVTDRLLIGQSIMFFGAGFETTSTTISFLLYELAKHKDAQARMIEEVDEYYRRHEGNIEYESINEMPFLDACVNETLRLYPVLGVITREVSEQYTLPTGLHLEKGTRIHIPVYYLHNNPEYFPEPEVFRPERFLDEEVKNVQPYTYMPFGEGPRICIGMRFVKMPIAAAILTIFKKHGVELTDDMPTKLDFDPKAFGIQANCDLNFKFIPRVSETC